jgi:thiamine biosynthesis protein ThiS
MLDTMIVKVNNKEVITSSATLAALLAELDLNTARIAVAVDKQIVMRSLWNEYSLSEGANITIITIACGG